MTDVIHEVKSIQHFVYKIYTKFSGKFMGMQVYKKYTSTCMLSTKFETNSCYHIPTKTTNRNIGKNSFNHNFITLS